MKNIWVCFFYFIITWSASGQTAQMVQDSQNIQALLDDMAKHWTLHDARAYSSSFSDEADFTDALGINAFGKDSIEKLLEKSFRTIPEESSLKIAGKKIRYITNDIIAVDAWWEMMIPKTHDGKDNTLQKGLANLILTRDGKSWFILIMHNLNLPE